MTEARARPRAWRFAALLAALVAAALVRYALVSPEEERVVAAYRAFAAHAQADRCDEAWALMAASYKAGRSQADLCADLYAWDPLTSPCVRFDLLAGEATLISGCDGLFDLGHVDIGLVKEAGEWRLTGEVAVSYD